MARERIRWPTVVDRAREIVESYEGGVTPRQVPHTEPMYRRLSAQLTKARREGRSPDLIDTVREVHVPPTGRARTGFLAEMPGWFRLDRTEGQEHALYVERRRTPSASSTEWLAYAGLPVLVVRGCSPRWTVRLEQSPARTR